jgi:hypothetical protein
VVYGEELARHTEDLDEVLGSLQERGGLYTIACDRDIDKRLDGQHSPDDLISASKIADGRDRNMPPADEQREDWSSLGGTRTN